MSQLSRIVKINNYTVVTNFKCMFSSLNLLQIDQYNPKVKNNVIFLYRNIFKKLISCFLHWCVGYKKSNNKKWLHKILYNLKHFNYKLFNNLLIEDKLIDAFKMFLDILKYIFKLNAHLHPQVYILRNNSISKIDNFINIDKSDDITKFEKLICQKTSKTVSTSKVNACILFNFISNDPYYSELIKNVYHEDIKYFQNLNVSLI